MLKPLSKKEAISLVSGPYLGIIEEAVAASIAPFLWREPEQGGHVKIRNGTVFFVTADRTLAVTAEHVFASYLSARSSFGQLARCQLGNLQFDPEDRIIARSTRLDVATFSISSEEIAKTGSGRTAMTFDPMVPKKDRGVLFVGFPGLERRRRGPQQIETGIFTALTVAENIGALEISGHFERTRQVDRSKRPTTLPLVMISASQRLPACDNG